MILDYTKQENLIDVYSFDKKIHVIGCGALGSWLTFFLLKMGFTNINVYDYDYVEEHNIPNQFFREKDIGEPKVEAIQALYHKFFDDDTERLKIHHKALRKFNAKNLEGIVFVCTDSMHSREELYEVAFKNGSAELWIEDRLGLFGGFIYTLHDKSEKIFAEYESTFYEDEEAEVSKCGVSQTALPSAVNVASMMIMQMISYYRGNDVYNSIQYQIPDLTCIRRRWDK